MTIYFEFEDVSSINTNLGSLNYGLNLIKAGLPVANLALGATSTNSYRVFTGELALPVTWQRVLITKKPRVRGIKGFV